MMTAKAAAQRMIEIGRTNPTVGFAAIEDENLVDVIKALGELADELSNESDRKFAGHLERRMLDHLVAHHGVPIRRGLIG